ncbi:hypothetical protein HD554DRAFT_2196738, partial [Boletus coccyginus]
MQLLFVPFSTTVVCFHTSVSRDANPTAVASLALLVWNCFVTLDDEVQYIWTCVTGLVYFFLRYVVLFAHIAHNFLIGIFADGSNPPRLCNIWFVYVVVLSQTLASLLEFTLASRVFALYNRSRKIAFLLSILILMEPGAAVKTILLRKPTDFYGTCLLLRPTSNSTDQRRVLVLLVLGLIVHCMLVCMTLFKYFFALRAGWGRTPLVSLVVRDGSTVYATMLYDTVMLASVVIIFGMENEEAVTLFFWTTSFISISGCHIILSMERFARRVDPVES